MKGEGRRGATKAGDEGRRQRVTAKGGGRRLTTKGDQAAKRGEEAYGFTVREEASRVRVGYCESALA